MACSTWCSTNRTKLSVSCLSKRGFSLLELLVVLLILAILGGLVYSAWGGLRGKSERTRAIAQLRQIGLGLQQFAAEHDGRLPGPMWPGQIPVPDPGRDGRLARDLAPYLGITLGSEPAALFLPPAFPRAFRAVQPSAPWSEARTFVLNMAVVPPGNPAGSAPINPWGNLAGTPTAPLRLAAVPSTAWALSDADQLHPRVRAAVWRAFTPAQPIHGPRRLALRFSGAVEAVEARELENP